MPAPAPGAERPYGIGRYPPAPPPLVRGWYNARWREHPAWAAIPGAVIAPADDWAASQGATDPLRPDLRRDDERVVNRLLLKPHHLREAPPAEQLDVEHFLDRRLELQHVADAPRGQ